MNHFSNKLIVKDPFEMPAVDDTTVLVLRECVDLVPHCWIWNESVGYLEVVTYSGYDIYVTVKNVGMKENATSGTIFPSCMEFLITAPNATPIIDNTVTCLRADFKCPTVGQEALMSVDSTSAIRVGDIIIVDTRYQYLVTEIINEHTMKVLNEEKGKEGGVIDVKCNECVPVKILESTHCCEALQEQVDDIYNRIDTKKSVVSNNVLLSVDHGIDAISDVSYDIELDIDTDLSKYDNTVSQFITLGDIPALPSDTDLSHYDNSTSGFITSSSLPTVNDAQLTIYQSDGVTPFVEFTANASSAVTATLPALGNTYTATSPISIDANNDISISQASSTTDGYLSSTDWNTFNNKFGGLTYFEEYYSGGVANWQPKSGSANYFDLGHPNNYYESGYVNNIHTKTLVPGGDNATIRFKPQSSTLSDYGAYAPYSGYTNCDLGTNTEYWNNGYINNIYTESLNAKGTSILVKSRLDSNNAGVSLGSSAANSFYETWLQYIKTYQIKNMYNNGIDGIQYHSGTSNNRYIDHNAGTNSSDWTYHRFLVGGGLKVAIGGDVILYCHIYPNTGSSYDIGDANRNIRNIYAGNIYSNTVEPNTVNTTQGSGHVGSASRPYNDMLSYQVHTRTVYASNSAIQSWTWPSDSKLKSNIELRKNESSLDKLSELSTYSFTYNKQLGLPNKNLTKEGNKSTIGFIAEEVEKILPDCVETIIDESTNEEYKSIKMYPLITMMLESIQELSAEVKELKAKLGEQDADSKVLEK